MDILFCERCKNNLEAYVFYKMENKYEIFLKKQSKAIFVKKKLHSKMVSIL